MSAHGEEDHVDKKGVLLKRKDFLDVDEKANSHPNRTYYFKRIHDLDGIIETCSRKLQVDPSNFKALYIRGTSFFKKGNLSSAISDLTHALRIQANHLDCLYYRGMAYSKANRYEAALSDLSFVLTQNPDYVNAAFARAALYNQMGLFPQAIEDYNFALSKDTGASSPKMDDQSQMMDSNRSRNYSIDSPYPSGRSTPGAQSLLSPSSSVADRSRVKKIDNINANGLFSLYNKPADSMESALDDGRPRAPTPNNISMHALRNSTNTSSSAAEGDADGNKKDNELADEYHAQGYAARKQNDFPAAIECYSRALQVCPNHFKSLFNRGFAYDKLQQYALALADYNQAIQLNSKHAFIYYNRGITFDHMGQLPAAIDDFSAALALLPTNLDFLYNRAYCYRKKEEYRLAVADFTQMLRLLSSEANSPDLYKNLYKAHYNRAYCLEQMKQLVPAIVDMTSILDRVYPGHLASLAYRAQLAEAVGDQQHIQTAIADYSSIIAVNGSISSYASRSKLYGMVGQYGSAVADLDKAIAIADSNHSHNSNDGPTGLVQLLFSRALCHKSNKNYEVAVQDLSRLLTLANQQQPAVEGALDLQLNIYHHRGYCNHKMDKLSLAMQDYTMLINTITSSNSDAHQAALIRAYNNRALVHAQLGNNQLAIADYSSTIALDPKNAHAFHHRGRLFDKMGMLDLAIADFGKEAELDNARSFDPLQGKRPQLPPSQHRHGGSGSSVVSSSASVAGSVISAAHSAVPVSKPPTRLRNNVSFDSSRGPGSPLRMSDLVPDPAPVPMHAPSSSGSNGVFAGKVPIGRIAVPVPHSSVLSNGINSDSSSPHSVQSAGKVPIPAPIRSTTPNSLQNLRPADSVSASGSFRIPVPGPVRVPVPGPPSAPSPTLTSKRMEPMNAANYLAGLTPSSSQGAASKVAVPMGMDIVAPGRFSTR